MPILSVRLPTILRNVLKSAMNSYVRKHYLVYRYRGITKSMSLTNVCKSVNLKCDSNNSVHIQSACEYMSYLPSPYLKWNCLYTLVMKWLIDVNNYLAMEISK